MNRYCASAKFAYSNGNGIYYAIGLWISSQRNEFSTKTKSLFSSLLSRSSENATFPSIFKFFRCFCFLWKWYRDCAHMQRAVYISNRVSNVNMHKNGKYFVHPLDVHACVCVYECGKSQFIQPTPLELWAFSLARSLVLYQFTHCLLKSFEIIPALCNGFNWFSSLCWIASFAIHSS
jgi:hypothetical protein